MDFHELYVTRRWKKNSSWNIYVNFSLKQNKKKIEGKEKIQRKNDNFFFFSLSHKIVNFVISSCEDNKNSHNNKKEMDTKISNETNIKTNSFIYYYYFCE